LFLDHSSSSEESLSTVKAESSSRPKKIKIYLTVRQRQIQNIKLNQCPTKLCTIFSNHNDENMQKYASIHSQFAAPSSKLLSSICA